MKHGKKFKSLSRTKAHRKSLLTNLTCSLIEHKRISTTLGKGKELRKFIEPILTKGKNDTQNSRRVVYSKLFSNSRAKSLVQELFDVIGPKISERQGGYTRIIKMPPRQGDNANMCLIELVDFNENLLNISGKGSKSTTSTAKKSRRGKSKSSSSNSSENILNTPSDQSETKVNDDLTLIEGVGPKAQEVLNKAGIFTFAIVANKTSEELSSILKDSGEKVSHLDTTSWPTQAKLANEGKMDELKELQDKLNGGRYEQE